MRFITLTILFISAKSDDNYNEKRKRILDLELRLAVGGKTTLRDIENAVNDCLMQHKFQELDHGLNYPEYFKPSHHYLNYKDKIQTSKVYNIIKTMPKGAVLHVHDMAIIGPDYLLNITYMDHLYVCLGKQINFLFSNSLPNTSCETHRQVMSETRRASRNITKFDADIRKHFTLVVENPDFVCHSIKESWAAFNNYLSTVYPLLSYRPIWEQYIYDVLKLFREDNVMYLEIRTLLPNLYELDGTIHNKRITAKAYRKAIKRFVKDYPDFIGAKLIFAPSRKINTTVLNDYIWIAREIKKELPGLFAGFNMVGQEDLGNPLKEFVPQLLEVKDFNFFFHAGETNRFGTLTDENLVDAVLLGAERIGHAFALAKHPLLIREVIRNDIGIEVNVISNFVLSLVGDLRNHPLNIFLSLGLPVILSSDDPGAWGAEPLSDDFYVVFMAVASKISDLRMLKTLAINSLKYSALEPVNKDKAIRDFHLKWDHFVDHFDCHSY